MSTSGVFIVLEGGEGCGKDANVEALWQRLALRRDVVFTREPGGTKIGERIRNILMDPQHNDMSVETELLLFLASRATLLDRVIRPALSAGKHVISNRFALSTIAYQIYRTGRHEYRSFLDDVSARIMGDLVPHYILLDVSPQVGLARVRARADGETRFDQEALETHERVRRGYLEAVQAYPHTIIDAAQPLQEVRSQVVTEVERLLHT